MESQKPSVQKRKYYCDMNHTFGLEFHTYNRLWYGAIHAFGIYGIYLLVFGEVPRTAIIPSVIYGYIVALGVTAGCHRYWSHRSYKARLPLQIFLALAQAAAAQKSIFKWCRDHRIHHKYTETNADPYNASRGFWFSHIGWLLEKEHPSVGEKENTIDLSDLDNDPVVRFQAKYYQPLELLTAILIPISGLHWLFPQMTFFQLISINFLRSMLSANGTFLVNSAAHLYGYRPYDLGVFARENILVAIIAIGEGWHNYHHVFPWDYKTSELGLYRTNFTCAFIDMCAKLGLAYDLKTVPHDVVMKRVERTGDPDLHHQHSGFEHESRKSNNEMEAKEVEEKTLPAWGWGDADIPPEHFTITQTLRPSKAG